MRESKKVVETKAGNPSGMCGIVGAGKVKGLLESDGDSDTGLESLEKGCAFSEIGSPSDGDKLVSPCREGIDVL